MNNLDGILVKELNGSDYYDGVIVQSSANLSAIFKLRKNKDIWEYKILAQIHDIRKIMRNGGDFTQCKIIKAECENASWYYINTHGNILWCTTLYTMRLSREQSLDILNI